jgi:hypothetical protein
MEKVAVAALVTAGAWFTVNVKVWVAVWTPFAAVNVNGYVPPEFAAGVPARVAVPPPLSVKLTPAGSVPLKLSAGAGTPTAVIVNVPAVPAWKLVDPWLVKPRMA